MQSFNFKLTCIQVQIERTKNDGSKLRKISLSEEEWDLLDELVDHLLPFEEATREFSGGTCVTFNNSDVSDIDYLNENTI
ncbi:hypothetical protein RhiirB3_438901 [Rhizophagus irregularis]|nr:hypothetical protein RhiirB3_438901 [Rhizophagus irregularis]